MLGLSHLEAEQKILITRMGKCLSRCFPARVRRCVEAAAELSTQQLPVITHDTAKKPWQPHALAPHVTLEGCCCLARPRRRWRRRKTCSRAGQLVQAAKLAL